MKAMDQRSRTRKKSGLGAAAAWLWSKVRATGNERPAGEPPASELFGPYTLHEQIGAGGMGVVFRATHTRLGRQAAVKLLASEHETPENLARFEREAELTSRLSHPNTVAVYDFGRTASGVPFYAMEYLDGLDLETLVDRHGPQDPRRVAHLLAQLAGALAEAHGFGFIHRDVKPANVMLCERGGVQDVVKVLDFGLTKELAAPTAAEDGGRVVGTPLYLSPEAIVAPSQLDARSDLYALGAVGYFLLTGAPPFVGESVAEVCGHHLHSTPQPLSRRGAAPVPLELERLILSCLAKSPEARPASAAALQTALLGLASTWTESDARRWWSEHERTASSCPSLDLEAAESTDSRSYAPTLLEALAG
jgi:serine/threonine protein kinase